MALISISIIFGENGLIFRAESSRAFQANAEAQDEELVNSASEYIDSIIKSDNPNFEIEKTVDNKPGEGRDYYIEGEEILYKIRVKNTGDVTIKNIEISDELVTNSGTYYPGNQEIDLKEENVGGKSIVVEDEKFKIESMEPDEVLEFHYGYTIQPDDLGGTIKNSITNLVGVPQPTLPRGHKVPQVEITPSKVIYMPINKVWEDGNNFDCIRPNQVTVYLLCNNEIAETAILSATNDWHYSFGPLSETNSDTGEKYEYEIQEEPVPGYTSRIEGENLINTHEFGSGSTEVSGLKIWTDQSNARGLRPASIQINLYQNGILMPNVEPTWEYSGDVWTFKFSNVPRFDSKGNEYVYTVRESTLDDYTTTYDDTNMNITNTIIPRKIKIEGHKIWNDDDNAAGLRPTSITVRLLRDNIIIMEKIVTADDGWAYSFTDLPETDPDTGRLYVYTIGEKMVEGYYARNEGYNLINNLLPTPPTGGPVVP